MTDENQKEVPVKEETVQMIVWERPSGLTITLADTENFSKLAKDNKWKRAKTAL